MFYHKFGKLLAKFELLFKTSKTFHYKKIHERKLCELFNSVTKTNKKRDDLVSWFSSKIKKTNS